MAEPLLYEVRDGIAHITLNRPEKLNAMNGGMADALRDMWKEFERDPQVRVGILSGAGKAFCAGRDISPGAVDPAVPFQTHQALPENGVKVFKPIVAAIHGYALGAGYVLGIRHCDISIAAESAVLGFPEAKAGVAIKPLEYKPFMPFKASLEFALLGWQGGRLVGARRAYELGLVNAVVPDAELHAEALRWAGLLKQIPPLYVRAVKRGHYAAARTKAHDDEHEYLDYVWPQEQSEDLQEARRAFLEKRAPNFTGR
ncbi:enoyl-CoA hydratase/isomerase family protein [Pigmentiphaga soli]